MITARRKRERREREAKGLPPVVVRQPETVTFLRHQEVVRQLTVERDNFRVERDQARARVKVLEAQLAAAGGGDGGDGGGDPPAPPAPTAEELELAAELEKKSKAELEALAKDEGLKASGTKAELALAIVRAQLADG